MRESYAEKGRWKFNLADENTIENRDDAIIEKYGHEIEESIYELICERTNEFEKKINQNLVDTVTIDCDSYQIITDCVDGDVGYLIKNLFDMFGRELFMEVMQLEEKLYENCKKDFQDNESAGKAADAVMECDFREAAKLLLMSNNKASFLDYFLREMKSRGFDNSVILGKYNQMCMSYFSRDFFDNK
jgi:hypothetical protein